MSIVPFMQPKDSIDINDYDERFADWTEEQYKHYEDSIQAKLYTPVVAHKTDSNYFHNSAVMKSQMGVSAVSVTNSHVPNSITVNKSKEVGQITIKSGTSTTGARTYNVPIDVYPGINGCQPNLALVYNSQQGNSVLGTGWSISGLSVIARGGKSAYYDGKTEGVVMDNTDSFTLDGTRLIKTSATTGYVLYESEQGNIKAKGYIAGNVMKYFEVFYPDGNKGVFGFTYNSQNKLVYPLVTFSDLHKNTINYSYSYSNNHYNISNISYNGVTVNFQYQSREDPVLAYCGGLKIYEPQLLKSVTCKYLSTELGTYTLGYTVQNNASLLTKVDYTAAGKSYNPIMFYYGEGQISASYTTAKTQLYEWYVADDPNMIKVVKGRFDYDSGADGLIALPNKNPYWKHYRHSTAFRHSQNRFDNKYSGTEKIFLYAGLKDNMAFPMPDLVTEKGFVDILCADIEGKQEEFIVKINNMVVNNTDQVTFTVYRSNVVTGLLKLYTRTYSFPTVYKDAHDDKSIQPKFYYTGDFNGDGKIEIMAVSVHQPFNDTTKPSICYIFDLANNKILYQGHVLPYFIEFVGTQQGDAKAAANNTDKLMMMDYNGDGKTDICHINASGVNIYTFDVSGSTMTARKIATYTGLTKSALANRDVLLGEFNGDGLMDLLVSPSCSVSTDNVWSVYNSKGDGLFDKSTFVGPNKSSADNNGFIIHDVNSDGKTDLIQYSTVGFYTRITNNNKMGGSQVYTSYPSAKSIIVPTDMNTHNNFTQLLCLKDGVVTKYSFSRNDNKNMMVTGMANSLGVIEKNEYRLLNDESGDANLYTRGYGAVYPYVNVEEPLAVIAASETYITGKQVDKNSFTYHNAVVHRQGLGFRGFEQITAYNKRGQHTVSTYEPYRFGVLKSEVSPTFDRSYSYSVTTQSNKISKIFLTNKVEKDLLKNITATTSYKHDSYGYPTEESTSYTGGIIVTKKNTYASNTTVGDGYNLGYQTDQQITVNRNGTVYTERLYIPVHSLRLPTVKAYFKNSKQTKQVVYYYDSHGNPISETLTPYKAAHAQKTLYEYDSHGRLTKVTNPMGLTNVYTYDTNGRVAAITDYKGTTKFEYDAFGREKSVTCPDNTIKTTQYAWATSGGLYSIAEMQTGKPTVTTCYDALNREIECREVRFDGTISRTVKIYDEYGNLSRESLPFDGSAPPVWNTYFYDIYNRITSCVEATGRTTTYSYSGNSVTTVADKIQSTKKYDALGSLISVTDPAGTIVYNLAADGQPVSIIAPGNVATNFEYDDYRRQTGLRDPSHGTTTYEYDAAGNRAKEINANGDVILHEYDAYNRLTKTTTPEFSTTYTYNANNELTNVSSTNGTSKSFTYDGYGRLSVCKENSVDGKWLQKNYTYSNGNVNSLKYTSHSGVLATERYLYSNGHHVETKLNDTISIYKLKKADAFGHPTLFTTGNITRVNKLTTSGILTSQSASFADTYFQNIAYDYDPNTSTLTSRTDCKRNITENFAYDNMNRLVSYGGNTITYDEKGNITAKSDVGTFDHALSAKPYAVSGATLTAEKIIPDNSQNITYTSFRRPASITENGYVTTFIYDDECNRVKMNISRDGHRVLDRYYLGDCYEVDITLSGNVREKLYLGGDYYEAPAVYVNDGKSAGVYYIIRDYLGSITNIVDSNGKRVQELSYDVWGRLRNPETHEVYPSNRRLFLDRGYTGHEHIQYYGLINMNARLYDPVMGRFLSPDPYVQMPDFSQNFNRYTYAMNNPLGYVDKDGQFIWIVIGAAALIGGTANVIYKAVNGQLHSWGDGFAAFGIGAVAGGVGAVVGAYVFAAAGGAAGGAGGFLAGAASGAAGSAATMPLQSAGNAAYFGDKFLSTKDLFIGIMSGALMGGVVNGSVAAMEGKNFWTGDRIQAGRGAFSFKNMPKSTNTDMTFIEDASASSGVQNSGRGNSVGSNGAAAYSEENTYSVYYGMDDKDEIRYIGITKREPEIRFQEHLRSGTERAKLNYHVFDNTGHLNRMEARIMEQLKINQYKMIKDGGMLYNMRNEISPKLWKKYNIK